MTIYQNEDKSTLLRGPAALVFCLLIASIACADHVVLLVDGVPEHGLVAKHVNLTSAVRTSAVGPVESAPIAAIDQEGRSVPFEFVPDADFDPERSITGFVVARLSPNKKCELKLKFGSATERPSSPQSVETRHYTVFHDPQKGGLPAKIVFKATGKVFENFRWQDRVHQKELGGFTLRNDRAASVEYLTTGPFCTAVRVKAAYLNSESKPPAPNPVAIYHWIYLHDLPLVFVTAEVKQAKTFEWNELHFLELNFPGEDFKSWAGGPPLSAGGFQATGKSHNATKWGALIEGRDAIAMFDCGSLVFHDGRGGYGTYLHAHADRAWSVWSTAQTRFSAWLWIGSADHPAEEIMACLDQSPDAANVTVTTAGVRDSIKSINGRDDLKWHSAMARQLEAAGRPEQVADIAQGRIPSDWTRVRAGELNLVLEKAEQGLRVLSLFDESVGQELLAPDSPPLFSMELRHGRKKEHITLAADSGWHRVEVSGIDASGTRVLTFQEPVDDRLNGVSVEVKLLADNAENALIWDLQVTNDSEQLSLWRIVFPQITVTYLGEGSSVFLPHTAGIELSDMWNTASRRGGTYPSGWTCMQYMAAYNAAGKTGLYIGMHDPLGSTKDILAQGLPDQRAAAFRFEHPVPDMGKAGVDFELPGRARWQLLRGDWFDAATVYRTWVSREAQWWPMLGPDGRSDTPQWMRQLPAWALTGGPASGCVPQVKAFAKELGLPVGFHWYNWHKIPFDNDYPHYFPPKDGFAEGVNELKEAGVYVMPYINGRLWDTHDKGAEDWQFTPVALAAATKDEKANPYTESYGSKESDGNNVQLAAMCPSTPLWQNRVKDIVLRLFNQYGLNGVYIDQIAAAQPRLCFDASHGHPLGGGHWWAEGYWMMLNAIRAAKPPDCMLTTECNAEPFIKWFDGYLTWHWQEQNMVPAFSAVYGGAVQMFGRAYRGGPTQDLANRMKAGQQLVFGEQIGWFGPEIIKRPECGQFLRDCIQLRWRLKKYFYAGQMARPPKLAGQIPTVTADWQWRGEWPITTPAIMTGAWQLHKDNKLALLFANVSDKPLNCHLEFDPGQYNLPGGPLTVTRISAEGAEGKFTIQPTDRPEVELAARSVLAWEIAPTQSR
jgi:hypothetical protein